MFRLFYCPIYNSTKKAKKYYLKKIFQEQQLKVLMKSNIRREYATVNQPNLKWNMMFLKCIGNDIQFEETISLLN